MIDSRAVRVQAPKARIRFANALRTDATVERSVEGVTRDILVLCGCFASIADDTNGSVCDVYVNGRCFGDLCDVDRIMQLFGCVCFGRIVFFVYRKRPNEFIR